MSASTGCLIQLPQALPSPIPVPTRAVPLADLDVVVRRQSSPWRGLLSQKADFSEKLHLLSWRATQNPCLAAARAREPSKAAQQRRLAGPVWLDQRRQPVLGHVDGAISTAVTALYRLVRPTVWIAATASPMLMPRLPGRRH